jgi:hypothetical protein
VLLNVSNNMMSVFGFAEAPAALPAGGLIKPRAVLAAVKTASRLRWPAASLDRRCARRGANLQAGTEKRRSNRTEKPQRGLRFWWKLRPLLCGWMSILRIKRRLSLQQDTSQTQQSICYTAQRTAVRVTALA